MVCMIETSSTLFSEREMSMRKVLVKKEIYIQSTSQFIRHNEYALNTVDSD